MPTTAPMRNPSRIPFFTQAFTRQPVGELTSGSAARMLPSFSPSLNVWKCRKCSPSYRSGGLSKSDSICVCNMLVSHEAQAFEHAADFLLVFRLGGEKREPPHRLQQTHRSHGGLHGNGVRFNEISFHQGQISALQ